MYDLIIMKRDGMRGPSQFTSQVKKSLRKLIDKEYKKAKTRSKRKQKWWYLKKRK